MRSLLFLLLSALLHLELVRGFPLSTRAAATASTTSWRGPSSSSSSSRCCLAAVSTKLLETEESSSPTATTAASRPSIFPNSSPAEENDIATLIRQTGQINPSKAAIGIPTTCACRHGFPQAFVMDPFYENGGRINSGLLKLTCPHLVRAIDTLEDEGMIKTINQKLQQEQAITAKDNEEEEEIKGEQDHDSSLVLLQTETQQAHERHAQVRRDMISSVEIERIRSKLGEAGAKAFLNSGVAGASPGSTDLKCLHAWLADSLFLESSSTTTTTNTNDCSTQLLGKLLKQELQDRGVDLTGTISCQSFCDPNLSIALADPPKPRNKQRLRTSKEVQRRKRRKKEMQ